MADSEFSRYFQHHSTEPLYWVFTENDQVILTTIREQVERIFSECKTLEEFQERLNSKYPMPRSFQEEVKLKFNLDYGISCAPAAIAFYEWMKKGHPDYLVQFISYNGYGQMHYMSIYMKQDTDTRGIGSQFQDRLLQALDEYVEGTRRMDDEFGMYDLIKDSDGDSLPGFQPVPHDQAPRSTELLNERSAPDNLPTYSILKNPEELLIHFRAYIALIQSRKAKYLK